MQPDLRRRAIPQHLQTNETSSARRGQDDIKTARLMDPSAHIDQRKKKQAVRIKYFIEASLSGLEGRRQTKKLSEVNWR